MTQYPAGGGDMPALPDALPFPPSLPLLDRDDELAALRRAWDAARGGSGRVVLVAGEAGIGKTTLLRALQLDLSAGGGGAGWLATRSYEHDVEIPYQPWAHLLCEEPALRARIAQPLGTQSPAAQSAMELARQTATAVLALAAEQPRALVFDDLDLADESSLTLVRAVAQRIEQAALLLVLAFRTPLEGDAALTGFVPALLREAPSDYLDLSPVGEPAIQRLVAERYPDLSEEERRTLSHDLAQLSGGNSLYLSELLSATELAGAGSGASSELSPRERLHRLPLTLRQIVEYRAARLSASAHETLRLAAIAGEVIDLDLLAALSGRDQDATLRDVEEALARGLLIEDRDGETRFRHGVVRRALLEEQSLLRRRRQHAAIVRFLRERPRTPPATLALHAELAGDPALACAALAEAGRRAERVFALPEAVRCYRRALGLAEAAALAPEREDELRLALVDSVLRNDRELALREAERVATRALVRDDRLTLARARQRQATLVYEAGRRAEARSLLAQAIPELEQAKDSATLAEALACLGYCYSSESDFVSVERTARRLLALSTTLGEPVYRAVSLNLMAVAAVARGEPEQAPGMVRESIAIMAETGHLDLATGFATVALMRVDLLANLHQPQMVAELIHTGEQLDEEGDRRLGLPPGRCTIEFAYWRFLRGEWDEARAALPDPQASRSHPWPPTRKDIVHTIAAEFALAEGRDADAEALLRHIAPGPAEPLGEHSYQQWLMAVERLILLRVRRGELGPARAWLKALDQALEEKPHVPGELLLDLSAARIELADGQPQAALGHLDPVVDQASRTNNMLTLIAAQRLRAETLRRAGEPEGAIQTAGEAIATAERCGLVYEAALSRLKRAEVRHGLPGRDEALRADIERASEVFARLGAQAALERAAGLQRRTRRAWPAGLTEREVAVLRLVAKGYSDRQIGEALYISPRTVSTHISNMLVKCDASNRVDLTAWAISRGIVGRGDSLTH